MKFFITEDFDLVLSNRSLEVLDSVVKIANAKLERKGKIVYNYRNNLEYGWFDTSTSSSHKALLINIETIEKCAHPPEKIQTVSIVEWQCECGKYVRPIGFEEIK